MLVALLVCLIPTTIGALLVGHRHRRHGPAGAAQRAGHVAAGPSRRPATARHAAARQDRHHHLRQPPGRRVPPARRRRRAGAGRRRAAARAWPTRRPRAARSSCWPRSATACASATLDGAELVPVHRPDPHERRRLSTALRSARARPTRCSRWVVEQGGTVAAELDDDGRGDRHARAARRCVVEPRAPAGPRRHPPQGHREGRHARALRRAPRHGHPHRDDHRRQPAHRAGHRRRGRRRRLPGRGHARGQDGPDQRGAGAAAASSP